MEIKGYNIHGISILKLNGDLYECHFSQLREQLDALIEVECPRVLLDLSQTYFIRSTVVPIIAKRWKKARSKKGDLAIFGANQNVESIFRIHHEGRNIPVYSSLEEAVTIWSIQQI